MRKKDRMDEKGPSDWRGNRETPKVTRYHLFKDDDIDIVRMALCNYAQKMIIKGMQVAEDPDLTKLQKEDWTWYIKRVRRLCNDVMYPLHVEWEQKGLITKEDFERITRNTEL